MFVRKRKKSESQVIQAEGEWTEVQSATDMPNSAAVYEVGQREIGEARGGAFMPVSYTRRNVVYFSSNHLTPFNVSWTNSALPVTSG